MTLEETLVQALATMVATIDTYPDDDLDPDVAADLLEPLGAILQSLGGDDRERLLELTARAAESETNPDRREVLEEFGESFGLVDDEE